MRRSLVWFGVVTACGGADPAAPDGGAPASLLAAPAQGFQIHPPAFEVPAGKEKSVCYYFTIPLAQAAGVRRWESAMSAGSHHLTVYFTDDQYQPDGTIVDACNAFESVARIPTWTYSAQTPRYEFDMPEGLGMRVAAQQHGLIQMHYLNATDRPLRAEVAVNAHTFQAGESYTPTAAYVTYSTKIELPGGVGKTGSAGGTCAVPPGVSFIAMTTHAHRRAVATAIGDDAQPLVASESWEHPTVRVWDAPFYRFQGNLAYRCDYVNDLEQPVRTGKSAETDEMCMAVGYFFPAERSILCVDDFVLSL